MIPLRIIALCSNVAFFIYGISLELLPITLLHAMLFPINIVRLARQCSHPAQAGRQPIAHAEIGSFLPMLIRAGLFSCLFLGVTCRPLTSSDISCTPEHLNDANNLACRSIARDALLIYRRFGLHNQTNLKPSPSEATNQSPKSHTRIGRRLHSKHRLETNHARSP
jgi:hypothetical protein